MHGTIYHLLLHLHHLRRFADIESACDFVRDERNAGNDIRHQLTEFARVVLSLIHCQGGLKLEKVHLVLLHVLAEVIGRMLASEAIGVVSIRKKQNLHIHTSRQEHIRTTLSSMYASLVTIIEKSDIVGKAMKQMYLFLGESCARIGNDILYTTLVHGDNISVSLHHIYLVGLDDSLLGLEESVQFATLAIDGRFWRVLILYRHALGGSIQYAATKTSHLATDGVPRKHHAPPEAVDHATVFALDGKTCTHEVLLLVSLLHRTLAHDIPTLGTETELELLDDVITESTFAKI